MLLFRAYMSLFPTDCHTLAILIWEIFDRQRCDLSLHASKQTYSTRPSTNLFSFDSYLGIASIQGVFFFFFFFPFFSLS